jgi:hypothetical protein
MLPSGRGGVFDNEQILNALERHNELEHWVSIACQGPFKLGVMGACCYWLASTKDARAQNFIENLTKSYPELLMSDPVGVLRTRISEQKNRGGSAGQTNIIWMVFRGWRDHINAKVTKRFVLKYSVENFPWPGGAPYLRNNSQIIDA